METVKNNSLDVSVPKWYIYGKACSYAYIHKFLSYSLKGFYVRVDLCTNILNALTCYTNTVIPYQDKWEYLSYYQNGVVTIGINVVNTV